MQGREACSNYFMFETLPSFLPVNIDNMAVYVTELHGRDGLTRAQDHALQVHVDCFNDFLVTQGVAAYY